MLITGTFLLTYTTSPISLTDGLESLMGPLKAVKVPVHELSMMMCIALRFIPTLSEETYKIMNAQKARGVDFSNGGWEEGVAALLEEGKQEAGRLIREVLGGGAALLYASKVLEPLKAKAANFDQKIGLEEWNR